MLVNLKNILKKANKHNFGVGAFNIYNLETIQAVTRAAAKLKSPVIMQTSESAIKYAGLKNLRNIVFDATLSNKIPICLHLDHGRDMKVIKDCINLGYSSVMIDSSNEKFEKNILLTKRVVKLAQKNNVSVEAELGTIGGVEDTIKAKTIIYTDPDLAKEFVDKTGIDALAVAIGTSHGAYKFLGKAKLNFGILKEIKKKLKMPLVLHGASSVPQQYVRLANKYGGKLKGMVGVPEDQLKKAVKLGINKINTDTDLRLAFNSVLRKTVRKNPSMFDPRKLIGPSRDEMQKIVEHRIKVMGSKNKK